MVWAGLVIFVFLFPENYFDYCGGGGNSIIISEDCEDCGQCSCLRGLQAAGRQIMTTEDRRVSLTEIWEQHWGSSGESPDLPLWLIRIVLPASNSIGSVTCTARRYAKGETGKSQNWFERFQKMTAIFMLSNRINGPADRLATLFTAPIIKSHAAGNHKWHSHWNETYNSARALNVYREMNNWKREFYLN